MAKIETDKNTAGIVKTLLKSPRLYTITLLLALFGFMWYFGGKDAAIRYVDNVTAQTAMIQDFMQKSDDYRAAMLGDMQEIKQSINTFKKGMIYCSSMFPNDVRLKAGSAYIESGGNSDIAPLFFSEYFMNTGERHPKMAEYIKKHPEDLIEIKQYTRMLRKPAVAKEEVVNSE